MSESVLVTGGAGFIGSHIVDGLVSGGHDVRIFDNLDPQVHGDAQKVPDYMNRKAKFVKGDVREREELKDALDGVDIVFHEASAVGVGQSMYQVSKYVEVNSLGTANLLDILANEEHGVKKVVVAASMSSYGEGKYECGKCGIVHPGLRPFSQMQRRGWEVKCPGCGGTLKPLPTDENKPLNPNSIYAISKMNQEQMTMTVCRAYDIPCVSLRYFNVYGPRQSLSNPYTGVTAIFMSRIKNNNQPVVYEDGLQTRDFVSVKDVVEANMLAMEKSKADYEAFNIGSGTPVTIKGVAEMLAKLYGSKIKPDVTNSPRKGDVRHCFADTSKIKKKLGWKPKVKFEDGMKELVEWSGGVDAVDGFDKALGELEQKGLV